MNLHDMLEDKLGIEPAVLVIDLLNKISVKDLYDLIERHAFEYNCNGECVPKNHPFPLLIYNQEATSKLEKKVKDLEEENAKMKAELDTLSNDEVYEQAIYNNAKVSVLTKENQNMRNDMAKLKDLQEANQLILNWIKYMDKFR